MVRKADLIQLRSPRSLSRCNPINRLALTIVGQKVWPESHFLRALAAGRHKEFQFLMGLCCMQVVTGEDRSARMMGPPLSIFTKLHADTSPSTNQTTGSKGAGYWKEKRTEKKRVRDRRQRKADHIRDTMPFCVPGTWQSLSTYPCTLPDLVRS